MDEKVIMTPEEYQELAAMSEEENLFRRAQHDAWMRKLAVYFVKTHPEIHGRTFRVDHSLGTLEIGAPDPKFWEGINK